jgi:hypothetical protein
MHESIAKAQTKGTFRVANQKLDALNQAIGGSACKHSKKTITQFVEKVSNVYGDLLLINKRKNKSSSWHFESEMVAIDPDPTFEKDIGILHEMVIEQVISRNLVKGKSGYRYFHSVFYVHEHYVQRLLQRTNGSEKSDFSRLLVNAVFCLASDVQEFKTDADACHVVYKDIVLIVNFAEALNRIVFKTILLKERFTQRQTDFYENANIALVENEADSFVCLYPESGNMRVGNTIQNKGAVEMAMQFPKQFSESPF